MRTKIINDTPHELRLKVGNNGIYRVIHVFPPGKEFTITLDSNATYREYVVMGFNDEAVREIRTTSDDMVEAAEITIYVTPEHRLGYRISKARGQSEQPSRQKATDSSGSSYSNSRVSSPPGNYWSYCCCAIHAYMPEYIKISQKIEDKFKI